MQRGRPFAGERDADEDRGAGNERREQRGAAGAQDHDRGATLPHEGLNFELMKQIIAVHHPHLKAPLLDQVLIKFYWLREQSELRKKPSTSELIDWIAALLRSGMSASQLESHIPFLGSLLKNEKDHEALEKYHGRGGRYPTEWKELGPRFNN